MALAHTTDRLAPLGVASLVRSSAVAAPLLVGTFAGLALHWTLESELVDVPSAVRVILVFSVAAGAVLMTDSLARSVLPLHILLDMAVVFRDQVPRKMALALRATSPRQLRRAAASHDHDRAQAARTVMDLMRTLTDHDRLTRGHSERVSAVTMMLADEMGITGTERDRLQWAALLHDVGKVVVSPKILNKPCEPSYSEWTELKGHPASGAVVAKDVALWLGDNARVIDQHHERFDGSGYPRGLQGDEIAEAARIVAVADAFEVMTGSRPYNTPVTPARARAELVASSGTHFDPAVVRAFASLSVTRFPRRLAPFAGLVAILL